MKTVANINMKYILVCAFTAALGGLLFGYDTAVVNGAVGYLAQHFGLSAELKGWAASSALVGCIFGAMGAGFIGDRFGRKKTLFLCAALFALSAIGSAIPRTLSQFVWARFIGGLGVGGASMLSPMYIAEISPEGIRGRMVSLYQLAIVFGILVVFFINMFIQQTGGNTWNMAYGWRWMFGSEIIPAVIFGIIILAVPESPRWLIKMGRKSEAMGIMIRVEGKAHAEAKMSQIEESLLHEEGRYSELFRPGYRKALFVGVFLAIFQQLSGINVVVYYSTEIMQSSGAGVDTAFKQTIIMGVVNLVATFVAIWLVDKLGRRILLIAGTAIQAIALAAIGILFKTQGNPLVILIFILIFTASFATAMGPVMWIVLSEIFPNKVRGRAMSTATLALWVVCYTITHTFPVLIENVGAAVTFLGYAGTSLASMLFIMKFVPETKGRTLEDIEKSWITASK